MMLCYLSLLLLRQATSFYFPWWKIFLNNSWLDVAFFKKNLTKPNWALKLCPIETCAYIWSEAKCVALTGSKRQSNFNGLSLSTYNQLWEQPAQSVSSRPYLIAETSQGWAWSIVNLSWGTANRLTKESSTSATHRPLNSWSRVLGSVLTIY